MKPTKNKPADTDRFRGDTFWGGVLMKLKKLGTAIEMYYGEKMNIDNFDYRWCEDRIERYRDDGRLLNKEEMERATMMLELELKEEKSDAQRKMAWFALAGMLLYPFAVVFSHWIGLETAGKILGDMAATYFVSVAAIVAAFFGKEAYVKSKQSSIQVKK